MSYGSQQGRTWQGQGSRRHCGCHDEHHHHHHHPPHGLYVAGGENTVVGGLNRIADSVGALLGSDLQASAAGPYERSFARYSVGTGTFHIDNGQGVIVVNGRMFTLGGDEDGEYEAVFRAWFQDPAVLFQYPPPAEPPFDQPSPVPQITNINQTKARWTFADGSSLSGPGPAISYIAALEDGFQFWVSAAAFITGGTGRYANAIGQECSLGSTWFPGPNPPVLEPGTTFDAKVTHTFRVILGRDRGPIPTPPPPSGGGGKGKGGGGGGGGA